MNDGGDPDDAYRALIREEHGRQRRRLVYGALPMVAGFVGGLGAGLLLGLGELQGAARAAAGFGLVAAALLFVWGLIQIDRTRPTEASIKAAEEASWGERLSRERTRGMLFAFLPLMGLMPIGVGAAWDMATGDGTFMRAVTAAVFLLMPLMPALALTGKAQGVSPRMRRYLDDEHTRAIRKQAMAVGFVVMMVGATGVYLIGLWRPELAVVLTVPAMAIGSMAAVGRFVLLERAAERGDDDG